MICRRLTGAITNVYSRTSSGLYDMYTIGTPRAFPKRGDINTCVLRRRPWYPPPTHFFFNLNLHIRLYFITFNQNVNRCYIFRWDNFSLEFFYPSNEYFYLRRVYFASATEKFSHTQILVYNTRRKHFKLQCMLQIRTCSYI